MTDASDFTKLVPGFDFLQGLMKNAGSSLPPMGQWIAPTLDPEELEKRIEQLKTVQFWLEQNARMLATTIQALEVQRMTLSTLKTMNLPLADLGEALKLQVPHLPQMPQTPPVPTAAPTPTPAPQAPPPPAPPAEAPAPARKARAAAQAPAAGVVDPMQWWGALTRQFGDLAAKAMQDAAPLAATAATQPPAGATASAAPKPAAKKPARKKAAKKPTAKRAR